MPKPDIRKAQLSSKVEWDTEVTEQPIPATTATLWDLLGS